MTTTRSLHVASRIEKARKHAEAAGHGLLVDFYSCGGYSTRSSGDVISGTVIEQHISCTADGHNSVPQARIATHAADEPRTTTDDVAVLISRAADRYRGLGWGARPTTQDEAAAADITAAYYLVPRADFPTVKPNAIHSNCISVGTYTFSGAHDKDPDKIRQDVLALTAWLDYLEQQQAQQAAQAAKLEARREALFTELSEGTMIHPSHKALIRAIDRIIDLEDTQP